MIFGFMTFLLYFRWKKSNVLHFFENSSKLFIRFRKNYEECFMYGFMTILHENFFIILLYFFGIMTFIIKINHFLEKKRVMNPYMKTFSWFFINLMKMCSWFFKKCKTLLFPWKNTVNIQLRSCFIFFMKNCDFQPYILLYFWDHDFFNTKNMQFFHEKSWSYKYSKCTVTNHNCDENFLIIVFRNTVKKSWTQKTWKIFGLRNFWMTPL